MKQKKIYYTMGEISEMFDVNVSLIRHWEKEFDQLKPKRNKRGNRLFSEQDVENFKIIFHLVKERGLTLEGARKAMKKGAIVKGSALERDTQIIEKLQNLRTMLLEIKDLLSESEEDEQIILSPELELGEIENAEETTQEDSEELKLATDVPPQPTTASRSKSREADAEPRELFAFFEQRLF